MILTIVLVVLAIISAYTPRYRIMKYEQCGKAWYVPQETTIWWIFWQNMQYAVSPYSDKTYKFDTLEEARKFLDSLNKDKIKKTIVK